MSSEIIWLAAYLLLHVSVMVRVLSVEGKEPTSRASWILVLIFVPALGIVLYLLFGEPWIPRSSRGRSAELTRRLAGLARAALPPDHTLIPERFQPAFCICESLADGPVTRGNTAALAPDSNAAIDWMVRDFDAAQETIHVLFYIWLADRSGLKVAHALKQAAQRGVQCRVIADGIGSRALIRSHHWRAMRDAGVELCVSLPLMGGLGLAVGSRVDLRNHRKIVVVDGRITYCGSQNCADPEFRVKPKYAPWVDIMLRLQGPVALQNQLLFASSWSFEAGENLESLMVLPPPEPEGDPGFAAIAFGSGPASPHGAMSSVFVSLLYAATREVVITNPYFVPDAALLAALLACARRGVATTMIFPARNDSRVVGAISKAHYARLVRAGVQLYAFTPGLLHAKTLVVDRQVVLLGSSNMDRRSLDLNYENNLLLCSSELAARIRQRQDEWLAQSSPVSAEAVLSRPLLRRIADNLATLLGPLM